MKKSFLLIILLVITLLITGCSSDRETKTLTCTKKETIADGVRMELSYNATYTDNYVDLIETEEKIISDNKTVLETYKNTIESMYSVYKNVEHYYYDVTISDNILTSITKIDYSKIDTNKMIEIDSSNAALIKNGKIRIKDLRETYESSSIGAICK